MSGISKFIERKLFLKVNKEKSVVAYISKVKFLGYGFYIFKGKCRFKLQMANCRKGAWRAALMLNSVLTNKEIASQGYMPMTSYYLHICEN